MRPCWGPADPSTGIRMGISIPHQAKGSHPHGLQVGVPISPSTSFHRSTIPPPSLFPPRRGSDLLVISKVVPNICARTNSAMMPWVPGGAVSGGGWCWWARGEAAAPRSSGRMTGPVYAVSLRWTATGARRQQGKGTLQRRYGTTEDVRRTPYVYQYPVGKRAWVGSGRWPGRLQGRHPGRYQGRYPGRYNVASM
jgi:hypothetical protein